MILRTRRETISFPIATPGRAVSFAMIVRSPLPCRTSSSMSLTGEPTPMKPPIISVLPWGMASTALAARMVLLIFHALTPGRELVQCSRSTSQDDRYPPPHQDFIMLVCDFAAANAATHQSTSLRVLTNRPFGLARSSVRSLLPRSHQKCAGHQLDCR